MLTEIIFECETSFEFYYANKLERNEVNWNSKKQLSRRAEDID